MTGSKSDRPFRRAVFRGLAILLPPLLTIVLFIKAWGLIEEYILIPSETGAGKILVWSTGKVMDAPTVGDDGNLRPPVDPVFDNSGEEMVAFQYENRHYTRNSTGKWVGYYTDEYVQNSWLKRVNVLPFFIAFFLLVVYFLGKFVAAGVGRMIVGSFDALIQRLPVVSNVYSSVKQVTDFAFSEREIEFNRVVAIEYPRKGIWSVGFVTGESILDIKSAANEAVLSVLMPTSPMPMTGFTVTVLKSEAVDLELTIDQAIQFVISCGVVVPPHQQVKPATPGNNVSEVVGAQVARAVSSRQNHNGRDGAETEEQTRRNARDD